MLAWMLSACASLHPLYLIRSAVFSLLFSDPQVRFLHVGLLSHVDWFHPQLRAGIDGANARLRSPSMKHLCDPISSNVGNQTLMKIPASSFVARPHLSRCGEALDVNDDKHGQKCNFKFNSITWQRRNQKCRTAVLDSSAFALFCLSNWHFMIACDCCCN